jgi:hypothetical protein
MLGLVFIKLRCWKKSTNKKNKKKTIENTKPGQKKPILKKEKKYLVWFGFDFRKIKLIKPDQTKLVWMKLNHL